jgi:hypothetical protein
MKQEIIEKLEAGQVEVLRYVEALVAEWTVAKVNCGEPER